MQTRTFPLSVTGSPAAEASADGALTRLRGIAVPYDTPTIIAGAFVETFARGAFAASLRATPNVPLLVNHDPGDPIGVADAWDDRRDGLHGVWRLGAGARAQEIAAEIRDGLRAFMSVRFSSVEDGSIWTPARAGELERVTHVSARLVEVSVVTTPAYAGATITDVRHAGPSVSPVPRTHRAPATPPAAPAPPKSYDGINALSRLAQDLGDLDLLRAVQGTDGDYLAAASLIRGAIDTYGPVYAVTELQRMAEAFAGTSDRLQLAGNLARAATVIDPAKLTGTLSGAARRRRNRR